MDTAWETRRSERTGEAVLTKVFPSGLRVHVLPKPGFQRKICLLVFRYGSLHGRFLPPGHTTPVESPPGVAHFLEHRIFQREEGDAFYRFASLGASSNAGTSYTNTVYYFSCVENFYEALAILLSFTQGVLLDPRDVEREKDIIEEEIRGFRDNPGAMAYERLMACLFQESRVRFDIVGTPESVRATTCEQLRAAFDTFYHPGNAELVVSGDLEPAVLYESIAGHPAASAPGSPGKALPVEEPFHVASRGARLHMLVHRPKFLLGFKEDTPGAPGPALALRQTESMITLSALFGRASDFYRRAYGEGLVDESFSAHSTVEPGLATTVFSADTDDPEALAGRIFRTLDHAKREGVDPGDVERLLKRSRGRYLRSFNHPESASFALLQSALQGVHLLDVPDLLDRITPEGIAQRLGSSCDPARHARSVVLPLPGRAGPGG